MWPSCHCMAITCTAIDGSCAIVHSDRTVMTDTHPPSTCRYKHCYCAGKSEMPPAPFKAKPSAVPTPKPALVKPIQQKPVETKVTTAHNRMLHVCNRNHSPSLVFAILATAPSSPRYTCTIRTPFCPLLNHHGCCHPCCNHSLPQSSTCSSSSCNNSISGGQLLERSIREAQRGLSNVQGPNDQGDPDFDRRLGQREETQSRHGYRYRPLEKSAEVIGTLVNEISIHRRRLEL